MSENVLKGMLYMKDSVVQNISEKFSKIEFVLEVRNGLYSEKLKMQLTNDNCSKLDNIDVGTEIEVKYNLKGREWTNTEGKVIFFNTIEAWFIKIPSKEVTLKNTLQINEGSGIVNNFQEEMIQSMTEELDDDLPF
jgi:hypothetical protein